MKADTRKVALRKESVDRNKIGITAIDGVIESLSARRAWIEMLPLVLISLKIGLSLSARRAWIEMSGCWLPDHSWWVALRKESVDRNRLLKKNRPSVGRSLSARRAWIEILYQLYDTYAKVVALRKESVDRNADFMLNA